MTIERIVKRGGLLVKENVILLLIIGLALCTRLINLENWPRWYADEGIYGFVGVEYSHGYLGLPYQYPAFNAPLLFVISGLVTSLLGKSFFVLRLPVAIFGVASVILLYLIVSRLYNRLIGVTSSLMFAVASAYFNRVNLMDNLVSFFLLATVLCYINVRATQKLHWNFFLGLSMALAFLSKYTGICAVIFVLFQSIQERKFHKIKSSLFVFIIISSIYAIFGLIIGWENFLEAVFPASKRTSVDMSGLLRLLLMGQPTNQLEWGEMLQFNVWSTLGLISFFYLLKRKNSTDIPISLFASIIVTYVIIGSNYWWTFLTPIYPIYVLGIAIILYDISSNISNFMTRFSILHIKNLNKLRIILVSFILILVLGNGFLRLNFFTNENIDQKAIVEFLSANTQKGDLVAVSPSIIYLLKEDTAVAYSDVAFYTTKIEFLDYTLKDRLPWYTKDISLDKMKYFVWDLPFKGLGSWVGPIENLLNGKGSIPWILITTIGDYKIYQNPLNFYQVSTLADDHQQAFWAYKIYKEGDFFHFAEEPELKTSGQDSLKIEFYLTTNNEFFHIYNVTQNWYDIKIISWKWYGSGSGIIALYVLSPDWKNYFYFPFTDDRAGWRQLSFTMDKAKVVGNPSWATIKEVAFKFHTLPTSGVVYLDELTAYK